jgi:multiple sugar transport system permease protein
MTRRDSPIRHARTSSTGLLFVLPALLALAMLIVYPVIDVSVLSVTDEGGAFVGLANFRAAVASPATIAAVRNTAYFVGASIVCQVIAGTLVGILLNRRFRGRGLVRALVLLPWVVPGIVGATMWAWMLHTEFGIINHLLTATHVTTQPIGWLTDPSLVMPALIAINVWKLFPFVAIMVLAGLQAAPDELYEAARVDGASFWHEVRHVMLPQIRPVLVAVTLLLTIWGLNAITIIYTITRGGPANRTLVVPIQIFRQAFESFQFHDAAALSVMFFAATLAIVALYLRVFRSADEGGMR